MTLDIDKYRSDDKPTKFLNEKSDIDRIQLSMDYALHPKKTIRKGWNHAVRVFQYIDIDEITLDDAKKLYTLSFRIGREARENKFAKEYQDTIRDIYEQKKRQELETKKLNLETSATMAAKDSATAAKWSARATIALVCIAVIQLVQGCLIHEPNTEFNPIPVYESQMEFHEFQDLGKLRLPDN